MLEARVGSLVFFTVFLACGFLANIISLIFSTQVGSGLTGATIGLVVTSLWLSRDYLDTKIQLKSRNTQLILVGVLFLIGFVSPLIGHVNYIGGVLAGFAIGYGIEQTEKQNLNFWQVKIARLPSYGFIGILTMLFVFAVYPKFVADRLTANGDYFYELYQSKNKQNVYGEQATYFYSRALEIDSNDNDLLLRRGQIYYLSLIHI